MQEGTTTAGRETAMARTESRQRELAKGEKRRRERGEGVGRGDSARSAPANPRRLGYPEVG
jgi:hypothetical protein